jgi:KDO2-lipid IV(A) lauroyltransferase
VLRLCAALVATLPWRWLRVPGALLGVLAGSVLRIRRRGVDSAMRRAGVARAAAEARAMYAALGAGVMELLWLAGASARRREAVLADEVLIEEPLRDALARALRRGPVVLAASHTGNWELAAQAAARALAAEGRALAVVAKPMAVGAFHAFCTDLREASGLRILAPQGAFGAARRALARGDVVAMPIDQVPDAARHGQSTPFLGAPALADRAPATLALRAGATLLVVAGSRQGARHRVHLLAALEPDGTRAWIADATSRATAALDAFVRREPHAWLWLHRRWRPAPVRLVASPHPG